MIFLALEATMDANRSKRLNFDAPLLTTKRRTSEERLSDSIPDASGSERIPFSWEKAPGKPKNSSVKKDDDFFSCESETPRLKPPPGRLKVHNGVDDDTGKSRITNNEAETPKSCKKLTPTKLQLKKPNTQVCNHEDLRHLSLDDGDNHDRVSETADVVSLTEAIDIAVEHQNTPKTCVSDSESDQSDSNGYLTIDTIEHSENLSPSYIIERFLPDAAALAAMSSRKLNKNKLPYFRSGLNKASSVPRAVRQSCFSPKGCGFHMFLPWGTKHRICGLKNSLGQCSHIDLQPKFSPEKK